ncbi:MAG: isoprenyl transferase [Planctomycetota bacterium]
MDNLPQHIAIIMDGNGRWATARGLDRSAGHKAGAEAVRPIVTQCSKLGLDALTIYSFSTENWTRAQDEVDGLMALYVQYLISERQLFIDNNVRVRHIGSPVGMPPEVLEELKNTEKLTAHHTGLTLVLAINYGSRTELTDATKRIAQAAANGSLDPNTITENTVGEHLYTAGLSDPDLLIRTAGEMRLSNYLLWQCSYAELYVTDVCWPEFDLTQLDLALAAYDKRTRKFGGVV